MEPFQSNILEVRVNDVANKTFSSKMLCRFVIETLKIPRGSILSFNHATFGLPCSEIRVTDEVDLLPFSGSHQFEGFQIETAKQGAVAVTVTFSNVQHLIPNQELKNICEFYGKLVDDVVEYEPVSANPEWGEVINLNTRKFRVIPDYVRRFPNYFWLHGTGTSGQARVTASFPGQPAQCYHCLQSDVCCPAAGRGKTCRGMGTERASATAYMKYLDGIGLRTLKNRAAAERAALQVRTSATLQSGPAPEAGGIAPPAQPAKPASDTPATDGAAGLDLLEPVTLDKQTANPEVVLSMLRELGLALAKVVAAPVTGPARKKQKKVLTNAFVDNLAKTIEDDESRLFVMNNLFRTEVLAAMVSTAMKPGPALEATRMAHLAVDMALARVIAEDKYKSPVKEKNSPESKKRKLDLLSASPELAQPGLPAPVLAGGGKDSLPSADSAAVLLNPAVNPQDVSKILSDITEVGKTTAETVVKIAEFLEFPAGQGSDYGSASSDPASGPPPGLPPSPLPSGASPDAPPVFSQLGPTGTSH